MKKYIGLLFSALLLASSCADSRYDEMVNDSAYFAKSDLQEQTVTVMNAADYVYNIWVHKGGYFQNKFTGSLAIDYNYLVSYNASHDTDYKMLDEKYYTFERAFVIEAGSNEVAVPLTLKMNNVVGDLGYGTYYIPFVVNSTTPDEQIYPDKANFLLALTLKQPILGIDGDNKGEILLDLSTETSTTYELDITAALDVEAPEDLDISYSEDLSLLAAGEKALDPKYYSYTKDLVMPAGEQYAENFLTLKLAEMPKGRWGVPVRMSTSNDKVKVAQNAYLKLTFVKGTLDDIQWAGDYLQVNEIIVPATTLSKTLIATTNGADTELSADQDWINLTKEGDNVYMTITGANTSKNLERKASVKIRDNATLLDKEITVRQCMDGYGVILNKSLWSIPAYSDNTSDKKGQFNRLFDNFWPSNRGESSGSVLEFNNRTDGSTPFVLTFDLGEEHRSYNNFGLMPRLEWTQPSPKRVKIEVSDDMETWTVLGPNAGTTGIWDAFTEDELKVGGTSWDDHYEGIVHWFELGQQTKRYIRLSMFEGYYQTTGKVICLNEVFVSNK